MAVFKKPVKKKHCKNEFMFSPYPISISNTSQSSFFQETWSFYNAKLVNDHLVVENSGDILELSTKGFFGKVIKRETYLNEDMEVSSTYDDNKSFDVPNFCDKELPKNELLLPDSLSSILYLNFFESFFLSYGLGCLFVKDKETNLSIKEQWSFYCSKNPSFPYFYAAYHHFRSKGWVPKDGIRYGADFLLYQKGPPFYHASYIVVVKCVNAESLKSLSLNKSNERNFSWENLSGLMRLSTTVSKEIMFCYVAVPTNLLDKEILSTDLNQLHIYETIVSRWVSSKEREKELLDIDCDF